MKEDKWKGMRIIYSLIFYLTDLFKPTVKTNNRFILILF